MSNCKFCNKEKQNPDIYNYTGIFCCEEQKDEWTKKNILLLELIKKELEKWV